MSAATPSRFRCARCSAHLVDVRPAKRDAPLERGCAICEPLVLVDVVGQLFERREPER